ncbi:MAG: nitrous oxide reductase family maturation protein NosD, partial [Epsilonproteobacteria bacterium]|nr:nitrous oxide reductase family maturation protein NosD [Campylobacterota bacterium]
MIKKVALFVVLFFSSLFSNSLQDAIDKAKPYSTLNLSEGRFEGHIVIKKPITIVGKKDKTVIDGKGKDTVISIKSPNVTLKDLTVISSGHRKENFDSAVTAEKADNLKVIGCKIKDSLYGIYVMMSKNAVIKNNYITSKDEKIPLRGDGLKLWYCNNALIEGNTFEKARDINLARSNGAKIVNNRFLSNRFATYLEMSHNALIKDNLYRYNEVAIMLMGSKNTNVLSNQVLSSKGAAGIGILTKEGTNQHFENNTIKYNTKAFYIDNKATEKGMQRYIVNNEISFNLEALHFHLIISNNTIKNNKIHDNLDDVVKDLTGYPNKNNIIEYNYWGNYAGFDKNHDNIGDTPYVVYEYADRLWSYNHKIKFFYGNVVISLTNFLCKLAPFTEPLLL